MAINLNVIELDPDMVKWAVSEVENSEKCKGLGAAAKAKLIEGFLENLATQVTREKFVQEKASEPDIREYVNFYTPATLIRHVEKKDHFQVPNFGDYCYYNIEGTQNVDEIYTKFVKETLGLKAGQDTMERFKSCVKGTHGLELQLKALQLSAFLMLLGSEHSPIPPELNDRLKVKGLLASDESQDGQLSLMPLAGIGDMTIGFHVTDESIPVKRGEEQLTTLKAHRAYFIQTPEPKTGNVKFRIERSFTVVN